ncbi:MAG: anti-sigma factor [Comamonadaceae bacterium]
MSKLMTPDEMHSVVDKLQPEAQRQALEALALEDRMSAETLKSWMAQRVGLRELHRAVLDEPIPATLHQAAERVSALQQHLNRGWHQAGIAAGVMLAFGVGWVSHGELVSSQSGSALLAKGSAQHEFVRQASFAHAVYLPEKRHPVEVSAAEQDHLVQWLSKRLGKPLKVPNLSAQGYELVGGRLLPGELGARAQFMFQDAQGQRITLYLGAIDQKFDKLEQGETRFRYESEGPVPSFYWFDQGFGYALAGQIPREKLIALATLVYQQL